MAPTASRAWALLVGSAVLEAVWASALAASESFSRPAPTAVFAVAIVASMLGLGQAARTIAISTAYAVWTGLGAALTVAWAMTFGDESASPAKVLLIGGIVAAVIGLKLVGHPPSPTDPTDPTHPTDPAGTARVDVSPRPGGRGDTSTRGVEGVEAEKGVEGDR